MLKFLTPILILTMALPLAFSPINLNDAPASAPETVAALPTAQAPAPAAAETQAPPETAPAAAEAETTPAPASAALTNPESVAVRFENEEYRLSVTEIGFDDDGNRCVTLSGFGDILHMRNSRVIAHVQAEIEVDGKSFGWQNLSVSGGNATFSFETELYPDTILLYSYDDPTRVTMTVLDSAKGGAAPAISDVAQELVGTWEGTARDGIELTFTVNPDGTGHYTFTQSGYTESYDFTLQSDTGTFAIDIPENNKLGISTCEGSYSYANEVLTLDITTTFRTGRTFQYVVRCTRAV